MFNYQTSNESPVRLVSNNNSISVNYWAGHLRGLECFSFKNKILQAIKINKKYMDINELLNALSRYSGSTSNNNITVLDMLSQ